jgi:hypothetical protein
MAATPEPAPDAWSAGRDERKGTTALPLGPLDEYLVHQIPETVDRVFTDSPNFYDRYYFNLHSSSDELFLVTGLGQYPNRGVTDAFVSVSLGDTQHTVRASRPLGSDRADTGVGPLRVEVLEGLRSLRVTCEPNQWGVAFELVFAGAVRALEEPKTITRAGDRIVQETFRFAQVGTWEGTLEVWQGARDHSWGIRQVGEPPPADPAAAARRAGFFHQWMPIQFDDHMVKITIDEDFAGRRVQEEAVRVWNDPTRADDHLGRPEITIDYVPGTREVARSEVSFSGSGASDLRIAVTPLRTVYLKGGSGYSYDGYWGHGVDHGRLVVEGLTHDVASPEGRARLCWLNETLSRYEASDGRVGYGMHENLCVGVYEPAGFDTPSSVAP